MNFSIDWFWICIISKYKGRTKKCMCNINKVIRIWYYINTHKTFFVQWNLGSRLTEQFPYSRIFVPMIQYLIKKTLARSKTFPLVYLIIIFSNVYLISLWNQLVGSKLYLHVVCAGCIVRSARGWTSTIRIKALLSLA